MTNVTYGHLIKYYFKSLYIPQINGGCASYFSLSKCSFLMISSAPILFLASSSLNNFPSVLGLYPTSLVN